MARTATSQRPPKPPALDPALLRIIEALAEANARADYAKAEGKKA